MTSSLPPRRLVGDRATELFAQDVAMAAGPAWVIRLEGDLGSGKTSFARAFIRALAADPSLEVPSPTYTLAQRYDEARPPVLHADLYRIADPDELTELGLDDPDDPAIRLIEWPERADPQDFPDALTIRLAMDGEDARLASVSGPDHMMEACERSFAIRSLLDSNEGAEARRSRFAGDASVRRYEKVEASGRPSALVMDAPKQPDGPIVRDGKPYSQLVHLAESVHAFAAIGEALRERGFAAPELFTHDLDAGVLLLEDLGGEGVLDENGVPQPERYLSCAHMLAELHRTPWPTELAVPGGGTHHLRPYDGDVFLTEIGLCTEWYLPHQGVSLPDGFVADFVAAWMDILAPLEAAERTLTLRDFHSPNIIWREHEAGHARVGIIDHQDALHGPPAYDLASLAQDARVTVSPELQASIVDAYCEERRQVDPSFDHVALKLHVAIMALQRNTKILGIFARLNARDGKPQYLAHLPRIETYVRQCLTHPGLEPMRRYYDRILPEVQN